MTGVSNNKAMKSTWIEAQAIDNFCPKMLSDVGIEDNHKRIEKSTSLSKEELIKNVLESEQICFSSSFVPSYPSYQQIEDMMEYFLATKVSEKRIISCNYFLESLNSRYSFDDRDGKYAEVFNNNVICELSECCLKRIQYHPELHKYVYSDIVLNKYNCEEDEFDDKIVRI